MNENIIVAKSLEFAVDAVRFCELLETEKKYVIARQLLRSATSIGANVFESQHAESRPDFIHKMKLAAKEANETCYWLLLCEKTGQITGHQALKGKAEELARIISKIIYTTKNNATPKR